MKDRLSLTLTDAVDGSLIQDFSGIATGITATSDQYGFTGLTFSVPFYRRYKAQRGIVGSIVSLSTGIDTVWEGRVEDSVVVDNATMNLVCTGRWAATADYTIPSSTYVIAGYDMWDVLRQNQYTHALPNKWGMSNNEGLYFTPKLDMDFAGGKSGDFGIMYLSLPDDDTESLIEIEFDYEVTLETNFGIQCQGWPTPMTTPETAGWTIQGNGTTQTGSVTMSISSRQAISFTAFCDAEGTYTNVHQEDEHYALITNIIVRTIQDPILTNDIAADLVAQGAAVSFDEKVVNSTNSIGISDSTDLILDVEGATAMDIGDLRFEKTTLQESLQFLAQLGNLDGEHVSTGVTEKGKVYFWLTDDWNSTWYVDALSVTFNESFEDMVNSVSVQYKDENFRDRRKTAETNPISIQAFGIEKQIIIDVNSKCDCVATSLQQTILTKFAFPPPRIKLILSDKVDAGYWRIKPNDYVVIQNVDFDTPDTTVTVRVEKISYNVSDRSIAIEPLYNPDDPDSDGTILQHYAKIAGIIPHSRRVEVSV